MRRCRFPALLFSMTLLAACGPSGSGKLVTEDREVGSFDSIEVSNGIALRLTIDPAAEAAVAVTYDDNIIDRIQTEVDGSTLRIKSTSSYNISGGGDRFVAVTVPDMQVLAASGGADVIGEGASDVLDLTASGGANVDMTLLTVGDMTLNASGGANVIVMVTDAVTGDASGGANVVIEGEPPFQSVDVSGGADVSSG